jgi:anti-sigma factor ChrR (cupin superfamily)
MLVNADFSRRVVIAPEDYRWIASPRGEVERMMLDRLGGEEARATSIVRYPSASEFPMHEHPGGEEIFVLSGVFSEGGNHYPAGWYLRNPPGSVHQPSSVSGALIFVKLRQMQAADNKFVRVDTRSPSAWHRPGCRDICPLFSSESEQVCLLRLNPCETLFSGPVNTAELLVLAGAVTTSGRSYRRGTWMRLPTGDWPDLVAGDSGVTLYLKTGHLTDQF